MQNNASGWYCAESGNGLDAGTVCAWTNGASTLVVGRFQDFYDAEYLAVLGLGPDGPEIRQTQSHGTPPPGRGRRCCRLVMGWTRRAAGTPRR